MWIPSADSFYWPSLRGRRGDTSANDGEAPRDGVQPVDARRVSIRTQRRLVSSLRSLANRRPPRPPALRRLDVLLYDRVPPVRGDLLEIAALLECAIEPDPGCVSALRRLLTDGCESPLYNVDVHPSEPRATLYHLRSRLAAACARPTLSE